ncbi:MAG: hypothetical protein FWB91_10200 [Defluviitaleaceae bacterium]|nr:hypothetical protein [Defluviitaleaceae bacterium]
MTRVDYMRLLELKSDPEKARQKVKEWKANAKNVLEQKMNGTYGNSGYDTPVVYESSASAAQQQLQGWLQGLEQDRELVERTRQAFGLTDRDNVQVFVVPRGQNRIRPGSVITRPNTSPRLQELQRLINNTNARIHELEIGTQSEELTDEEKSRMKNSLRNTITQNERALNRERARIATLPRSGWIVVER